MTPDIKNALMLKINDIKTGDSITKKILEHLRQTDDASSFKTYIKFNISQVTSNHSVASPSSNTINPYKSDYHKSNPWTSQTHLIPQQYDVENNKFFVYGLFFIPSETGPIESSPVHQDPNRLVFFIFNTVPENIKSSLIQTNSNTYLTRKLLFPKTNEIWNTSSFEYKFYLSKNSISKASSNQDLKSQPLTKNLKKLSDILKHNLALNSQNDSIFLHLLDSIEENCAKTYIQSVVHYIASDMAKNYSLEKSAVQHLLSLGQKIPLNDIDLTDYFKMSCKHMTKSENTEPCSTEPNSYLALKFDEIFLKRFQSIPGFDDLFIFQTDSLDKEIEVLPQVDYLKYDEELSLKEETSDESETDSESIEENFYESDSSDFPKKKTRRKTLKSSSPYSNPGKHLSSNETSFVSKEHIIGIEIMSQISCEDAESRTRTTTLTPENNDPEESITNPTIQNQNKKKFYSKFTKFNFNCILNLNEIKDCLKTLIPKVEESSEDVKNFVKIFLRFNWYSFNDSNLNRIFPPSTGPGQNIGSSNLSTHSSTTTVFNTGLNSQFLSQKLEHKFENFHLLEPSLREFKWHLKDELLNNEISIKNARVFQYYMNHIKYGFDLGYLNCAKFNKKTTYVSNIDPSQNSKETKLSSSLLHGKNQKLFSTTQVDEDKSILRVDAQKFYSEFSLLLKTIKFYDCNVQAIGPNLYYLNCLNVSKGLRFKIFLTTKKDCVKTNSSSSNAKSSPSQEGSSSPTSHTRLTLQKQSMKDLQKLNAQKNSKTHQETVVNQLKLKAYFSFNHLDLETHEQPRKLVADLVNDFDCELEKLIRLCYLKLTLKDIDETRKWNNSLILFDQTDDKQPPEFTDASLTCSSVWSVFFKLHRLHQTLQKVPETNNYISQGLSKLRECLQNFKIYESSCADLYVYTHNKEIYLLKLDEVYDEEERRGSILSRRPSYASINDSDQTIISSRNTSAHAFKDGISFKSQNLSGGQNHGVQNQTPINSSQIQSKQNPPEYVKLSVFALEEPDDEMKKDLCKTLQSELDYWVLNKMCTNIEKNTYKATSQQHLERITDEDLTFFRQVSDNTFDYELSLPFVFNFNRTLRENFFFFVKQVFNSNFKAIDVNQTSRGLASESTEAKHLTSQLSFSYIPDAKNFTKKHSDPLHSDMILISRIFFQNSKSNRFGKQNVSLILVEAMYSVRGLDLASSKVTRSNSMGASTIKFPQETSERKNRQIGPTFVFRFYCRGENTEITNYKLSIKTALNDALVYFLSDYVTKIDSCEFVKKINLKRRPAKFRIHEDLNTTKIHRKRHKSTGATELNTNKQFLGMNKTARDSKLGRLLTAQKIIDLNQFNSFVLNNFSHNLFDHKDYEDTLQYFKEPIRILNCVYSNFDSDESETTDSEDEEIALYKVQRSISMEPDLSKISLDKLTNEKTCLKLIYDWLKGINSLNKITSPNPQQGSFVLRKQFLYRTKYNLVNLIKDLESSIKEMCKCEINANYFSFRKEAGSRESSRHNDSVFMEDDDLDIDDFESLKMSRLGMLSQNLGRGESLLVTLNAEYGGMNSGFSSMSSSMNSSTLVNYARVPSFSNASASTLIQSSSSTANTVINAMMKSVSSTSGDLDSSFSLSNSLTMSSMSVKRTFCYCIVNAKLKNFTFYCFTTESDNYAALKQLLDQTSDLITQRFHLVNNTVLYKFGGLIGDNIIHDLKKVKQLAASASCSLTEVPSSSQIDSLNQENKIQNQKQQITSIKLSKSPTIHRSISYNKPSPSPINPALIANLQFNSSNLTLTPNNSSSSVASLQAHSQQSLSIKQLTMSQFNIKSYDSIVNIINQQVNFCIQYLTAQPSTSIDYSSVISPNNVKSINQNSKLNSLYGVGLCYQLLEMQQIYRHPRKIYELAIGLGSQQNISPNSQTNQKPSNPIKPVNSGTSLVSPVNQTGPKFNLNEFYKNYIQPVMIPFHYCCTTLLFYSNWNELIMTEKMLKKNSNYKPTKSNVSNSGNESWYFKMRQIVLVEYSKYFESRGFVRLKDDRQIQEHKNNKNSSNENQILHFIKWLQQDGFLYLTINLEEIYLHARIGYCSRYRSSNRQGFINDMMRFLTQDFHVHSFIYDFHLSAINSNFLSTSQSGMLISQTSYIISKFLDEFVDFFLRVPLYSSNKVYKIVYEKPDNSLKPNQYTLIFDFISYANKKLNIDKLPIRTLHTFGNNLTIYSLSDSENCSKYLIVKIEQFQKEVLRGKLTTSQSTMKLSNSFSSTSSNQDKIKRENFIRITCFYLFINKTSQLGLLASQNLITTLNNDIEFVKRVIEESISMHRQEIFWDNLALSMQTIKNIMNETSNSSEPLIGLEINNQELEQILGISQQINILDLDRNLEEFMNHCYEFRDKIKNYLKFQLGQHFIYTESESVEYCLLIINEGLIKNFRFEQEENKSPMSDGEHLNSFVLIKFDKGIQKAELFQVNRVKIVEGGLRQDLSGSGMASSRESGHKNVNQVISSLLKSKSYKNLAFTINILMYILWENLFLSSEGSV